MKPFTALVFGMLLLFCVSTCFAQKYYLKINGMEGESSEKDHREWIEVLSFNQGVEQAQSASGAARQRASVNLNDLIITKNLDKATPKLMEACSKGEFIRQMELNMVVNGIIRYKLSLGGVKISSITTNTVCDPDCKIVDQVAFSYSQITWLYLDKVGMETSASYNAQTGN